MQRLFCFLIFVIIPSLSVFAQSKLQSSKQLIAISISYVDFNIKTSKVIECNLFEELGKKIKTKSIKDTVFLNIFYKELMSIKEINSEEIVDTRIKIELVFNDYFDKILCIGKAKTIMYLDDKALPYDEKLIVPILKYIGQDK